MWKKEKVTFLHVHYTIWLIKKFKRKKGKLVSLVAYKFDEKGKSRHNIFMRITLTFSFVITHLLFLMECTATGQTLIIKHLTLT